VREAVPALPGTTFDALTRAAGLNAQGYSRSGFTLMFESSVTFQGANMVKSLSVVFLLALAGCSGLPRAQYVASPCSAGEATYACQVERYHNVNVN
jgi:hypothetical protein